MSLVTLSSHPEFQGVEQDSSQDWTVAFAVKVGKPEGTFTRVPLDLTFLADASPSMDGYAINTSKTKYQMLVETMRFILSTDLFSSDDSFQIGCFSGGLPSEDSSKFSSRMSMDKAGKDHVLGFLENYGGVSRHGTDIGDPLFRAIGTMKSLETACTTGVRRRAIILLTDGQVTSGTRTPEIEEFVNAQLNKGSKIEIHTIGFGNMECSFQDFDPDFLRKIAYRGSQLVVNDIDSMGATASMFAELASTAVTSCTMTLLAHGMTLEATPYSGSNFKIVSSEASEGQLVEISMNNLGHDSSTIIPMKVTSVSGPEVKVFSSVGCLFDGVGHVVSNLLTLSTDGYIPSNDPVVDVAIMKTLYHLGCKGLETDNADPMNHLLAWFTERKDTVLGENFEALSMFSRAQSQLESFKKIGRASCRERV